jgi:hypothetical protein
MRGTTRNSPRAETPSQEAERLQPTAPHQFGCFVGKKFSFF